MTSKTIVTFNIKGKFKNKGELINFSRNIRSLSESDAKEKIYLHFGSNHKIRRQNIKFDSISIIDDVDDPTTKVLSSSANFKLIRG